MSNDDHDHAPDGGFSMDMRRILARRSVLGILGLAGAGAAYVAFRGAPGMAQETVTATAADGSVCVALPGETAGPYPGDGTNVRDGQTVNALAESGIERSDIRPGFAGMDGMAEGVPMTLEIRLVDIGAACAPLANRAVYLWHCNVDGLYSLYSAPETNYLRGLQISDADGVVRFQTIFPGCYDGRWPHMHFEVFESADLAVNGHDARLTSQFALPEEVSAAVYAADARYAASVANLERISIARDNVFSDNSAEQIAAMTPVFTGDIANGFVATVTVGL